MSELKLYTAVVEFAYHVAATTQEEAQKTAQREFKHAFSDAGRLTPEVKESRMLEDGWVGGHPYSAEGVNPNKLTCDQIFAVIEAKREADEKTKAEFDSNIAFVF